MPRAIQRPSVRRSDSRPIKRVIYTRRGSCRRESRWRALRRAKTRRYRRVVLGGAGTREGEEDPRPPGRLISVPRLPKIAQTEARKLSPLSRRRAFWENATGVECASKRTAGEGKAGDKDGKTWRHRDSREERGNDPVFTMDS